MQCKKNRLLLITATIAFLIVIFLVLIRKEKDATALNEGAYVGEDEYSESWELIMGKNRWLKFAPDHVYEMDLISLEKDVDFQVIESIHENEILDLLETHPIFMVEQSKLHDLRFIQLPIEEDFRYFLVRALEDAPTGVFGVQYARELSAAIVNYTQLGNPNLKRKMKKRVVLIKTKEEVREIYVQVNYVP
jgi:hypothetical protein